MSGRHTLSRFNYAITSQHGLVAREDASTLQLKFTRGMTVRSYVMLASPFPRGPVGYFENSVANARYAAETRVLHQVPVPDTKSRVWKAFSRRCDLAMTRLANRWQGSYSVFDYDHMTEVVMQHYSGTKRARYLRAISHLRGHEVQKKHSKVKIFVKTELVEPVPGKLCKPRMISFRSDEFLLENKSWADDLERHFYGQQGGIYNSIDDLPECAKGHNMGKRANIIGRKVASLQNPRNVSLDGSAFDAHVHEETIRVVHKSYRKFLRKVGVHSKDISYISHLLKMEIVNQCVGNFPDGTLKYTVRGNRMSGDWETAFGNCLIMSAMVAAVMDVLNIPESCWRQYDDGDDCLLFVEAEYQHLLVQLPELFKQLGMSIKVSEMVDAKTLENIEFCQSRPVFNGSRYIMCRNPQKMWNSYFTSPRWFNSKEMQMSYHHSIGYADSLMYENMPVISQLAYEMYSQTPAMRVNPQVLNQWRYDNGFMFKDYNIDISEPVVTPDARESFSKAWGISPTWQVHYENLAKHLDVTRFIPQ